jgi:hypothetical protein
MTNTNRIQNLELTNERQLAQTRVTTPSGQHVVVSTVQLPLLWGRVEFESMTFAADVDGEITDWLELSCNRYSTVEHAMEGHADMVQEWYNEPMRALPAPTEEIDNEL